MSDLHCPGCGRQDLMGGHHTPTVVCVNCCWMGDIITLKDHLVPAEQPVLDYGYLDENMNGSLAGPKLNTIDKGVSL